MGGAAAARRAGAAACGVLGCALLLLGLVLIVGLPAIIKDQVTKNVMIQPNSMFFNLWKDIPIPFYFSVYFFDVLNPDEVLAGMKPAVQQRGPYVYREFREKTNITFHENGTVSFLEYRRFYFQPDMSNGTEEDFVIIPNLLVLGAAVMLEDLKPALKIAVSAAFTVFKQTAFLNRTVGEILWGYEDPILKFLNSIKPGLVPFQDKFGLLISFNNSNMGLFTAYTGANDISKVNMVDNWNGLRKVSYWRSDQCNSINGTYGEIWPPLMTPSSPLEFYSPDACRSLRLQFKEPASFQGVPIYRYVAPKTLFANGADYPPNEGFCPCRQSGIQNMSSCRLNSLSGVIFDCPGTNEATNSFSCELAETVDFFSSGKGKKFTWNAAGTFQENGLKPPSGDVPMFLSHPHFLNADPELLETVDGLHPSEEKHGLFLEIHPLTGVPMNVSVKLQLSLFIKRVPLIVQTGHISPVVMPVFWFEERGVIDERLLNQFYTVLVLIPTVLGYVQYCAVGLGGLLLITMAFLWLRSKRNQAKALPTVDPQNSGPQDPATAPLLNTDLSPNIHGDD